MKNESPIVQDPLPSRDNFPKGLRGGGHVSTGKFYDLTFSVVTDVVSFLV